MTNVNIDKNEINMLHVMLLQDASLIVPQYPSIMKYEKHLTNTEISRLIIPFFYYTTLIAIPIVYSTIVILDLYWIHLITVICPIVASTAIIFSPKYRNNPSEISVNKSALILLRLCYSISSVAGILRTTLRHTTPKTRNYHTFLLLYKLQSDGTKSACAWISQDFHYETSSFELIYVLSYCVNGAAVLWVALGDCLGTRAKSRSLQEMLSGVIGVIGRLSREQVINEAFLISNSAIKMFLGLFAETMLFEIDARVGRKNQPKVRNSGRINQILYKTVNLISRLICLVTFQSRKSPKKTEDVLGVGYVTGCVKLLSTLLAYVICEFVLGQFDAYTMQFYAWPLLLVALALLVLAPSRSAGNVLLFAASVANASQESFGRSQFVRMEDVALFSCLNMLAVSLLSSLINFLTGFFDVGTRCKCVVYVGFGAAVYLIILSI
ncbi:hypothetical protein ECANGB1_2407 [Enterospora canceri]|uniref:Uncharacterized protein n=1 Tax=Enterospora canceri TaxID=1081671 RepID=A0A1Y1S5V1_9MICR|nr:hypothetical protein ECANGB1_2407 [Enterospora canceri]